MNKFLTFPRTGLEIITKPHPSIIDPRQQLEAKTCSFMSLIMILGVSINLIFGSGLTPITLIILILGYGISRTIRYSLATYLIIGVLLYATIHSLLSMGLFDSHAIFTNLAWVTLSLVFASLLLSIRELIIIVITHLIVLYLLTFFVPAINFSSMVVAFGYLSVFSTLLIITMWQRNVIEQARQEEIRKQATHDQLTGLPNRALFHSRLEQVLARIDRKDTIGSILYLDLDDFKNVNDEYNHKVGDQMLKVVAERIQQCISEHDTAARISGDEFVILLEDVNGTGKAAATAEKLLNILSKPIKIDDSEVIISGSVGIVMIPENGNEVAELLINADAAMYTAKNEGKNAFSFFTSHMKDKMLKNISMSRDLNGAIEREEFYLDYQPQYDARTGKIFGAEALLRWQHPINGIISPNEFIPIAEKNGMILPLGDWVISNVVTFLHKLGSSFDDKIRTSINISGRQLKDDHFVRYLAALIKESRIDPDLLELEITENSIFNNNEETRATLKRIKAIGVRLAIDDFGTGYSSLSYLQKLPFDTVKIDISFIQKINMLDAQLPILTGIISIANELGMDVIAEGVENETQLNFLSANGCNLIQGHYFNPPSSDRELVQVMKEQKDFVLRTPVAIKMFI